MCNYDLSQVTEAFLYLNLSAFVTQLFIQLCASAYIQKHDRAVYFIHLFRTFLPETKLLLRSDYHRAYTVTISPYIAENDPKVTSKSLLDSLLDG